MTVIPDSLPFEDPLKLEFLSKVVIPEGIKMVQKYLKIDSVGSLPVLASAIDMCPITANYEIPETVKNEAQQVDYIVLIEVENNPTSSTLARARYCLHCMILENNF